MKRHFLSLFTAFSLLTATPYLIVLPPAAAVLATGCASVNKTAYKATGAVVITVDAAMSAWGAHVKANHPPVDQEVAVKNAFEKYQAAASVVATAGAAQRKLIDSGATDTTGVAAALNSAITVSAACLSDLITLLQTFGVKL